MQNFPCVLHSGLFAADKAFFMKLGGTGIVWSHIPHTAIVSYVSGRLGVASAGPSASPCTPGKYHMPQVYLNMILVNV